MVVMVGARAAQLRSMMMMKGGVAIAIATAWSRRLGRRHCPRPSWSWCWGIGRGRMQQQQRQQQQRRRGPSVSCRREVVARVVQGLPPPWRRALFDEDGAMMRGKKEMLEDGKEEGAIDGLSPVSHST